MFFRNMNRQDRRVCQVRRFLDAPRPSSCWAGDFNYERCCSTPEVRFQGFDELPALVLSRSWKKKDCKRESGRNWCFHSLNTGEGHT